MVNEDWHFRFILIVGMLGITAVASAGLIVLGRILAASFEP